MQRPNLGEIESKPILSSSVTFPRRFWAGISAVFTQFTTVTMAMPRGALRIVLVREWIAEQRHQSIPELFCHMAAHITVRVWVFTLVSNKS